MITNTKFSMIVISVVSIALLNCKSPVLFYDHHFLRKLGLENEETKLAGDAGRQQEYNLPNDVVDKIKQIIKAGGLRGFYTKEEMDYLLQYPSPAYFCRHKVDPIDIWTDVSRRTANLIGKGTFGKVYKGKYSPTTGPYSGKKLWVAVKYLLYIKDREIATLKEINFLRTMSISHHHLPFYQCYYEREEDRINKPDKRPQVILMTDLMKGDAEVLIRERAKRNIYFGQHNHNQFLLNMAKGIKDLHITGIIHRDIKPGNFFIDAKGNPIVGDLGIAEYIVTNGNKNLCGTPFYIAPEVLNGSGYGKPFDVYSLGITFAVLISAKDASMFVDFDLGKTTGVKKSVVYYHLIRNSKYLALIQAMTKPNPSERITIQKVIYELQHIQENKRSSMTPSQIDPPPTNLERQMRFLHSGVKLDDQESHEFNKMII